MLLMATPSGDLAHVPMKWAKQRGLEAKRSSLTYLEEAVARRLSKQRR